MKITIQLFTVFVSIVYKSNLEAQNHVLEIIYTLHHKLQGTPMTKKTHQHFCLIKNATTSIPDSESSLELRSKSKVDLKKVIHTYLGQSLKWVKSKKNRKDSLFGRFKDTKKSF